MTNTSAPAIFKGVLTVGFLAFAAAIVVAHLTPATNYELSIYRSTPVFFWVGIGIGVITSLVTLFATDSRRLADGGALLLSGCLLAVVSIPLLRSYAFYGAGDSLTHLGWAREIHTGVISPDAVLYPVVHLIGVELTALSGLDLTTTLQFSPALLFPAVYLITMPMCVGILTESRWALPVGLGAAVLLIPINKISVHVLVHPSSQAILFAPFVLYLLFLHLDSTGSDLPVSATGVAFSLAAIGIVFIHPQETMVLVSLLVAIVGIQFVARRYRPNHPIAGHRPIGIQTFAIGTLLIAWLLRHERATSRFEGVVSSLATSGATTGGETAERGASLAALGGSFEELFLKLFAVSLVFCALAGGLALLHLSRRTDGNRPWRNAAITYLTFGLFPPFVIFMIVFLANQDDHYFRFHGFIMAIVTILGAVALVALLGHLHDISARRNTSITRSQVVGGIIVVFVMLVAAQMLVVHMSPYMYQPNQQVNQADFSGHEIAFEHHDGETTLVGLRRGQGRHIDAHFGRETARGPLEFPGYRADDAGVSGEVFSTNLTTHFEEDRYLVIGDRNEQQEIGLYNELRFTRAGFDRLETDHRVSRVQDNGEFRLYRIDGTETE